jgi:hypothetical protein
MAALHREMMRRLGIEPKEQGTDQLTVEVHE